MRYAIKKTVVLIMTIFTILTAHISALASQSAALSYCIADLKFTGKEIKICELGTCATSGFRRYEEKFNQPGKIWTTICEHANSFGLPMWYIAPKEMDASRKKDLALDHFQKLGGKVISSIAPLHNYLASKNPHSPQNPYDITQYQGIVFLDRYLDKETKRSIENFKRYNPYFIFPDSTTKHITANKALTNLVFTQAHLDNIKTPWIIKNKEYTSTLAQEIITTFNHPIYVLKPLTSSLGRGVIIVTQEELDLTLKTILTNTQALQDNHDLSYQYWSIDHQKQFLIEAFIPSKEVEENDHYYDGTIRGIMAITYYQNNIAIDPLDIYWKLPKHHLNEKGSLNEQHKSYVNYSNSSDSFARVSPQDTAIIYAIIEEKMPSFFAEIMQKNNNQK